MCIRILVIIAPSGIHSARLFHLVTITSLVQAVFCHALFLFIFVIFHYNVALVTIFSSKQNLLVLIGWYVNAPIVILIGLIDEVTIIFITVNSVVHFVLLEIILSFMLTLNLNFHLMSEKIIIIVFCPYLYLL